MATATGSTLMQEIYDQFLVCKICFEAYKRPKTLSCLHIFCTDCLEKHIEAERERSYRYMLYSRAISCPICRKKTELPSGGVKRLPDNFLVGNLTDVINRRMPTDKLPLCEICQSSLAKQAVSKCLDCSKFLCVSCVDLHKRTKVTASHSLFDTEVEKDIECKMHQGEVVRFYCEMCETCICVLCTFQEHKGHDVVPFTEGMEKYRNSLDSLVHSCRERIDHLKEHLDMINKCESVVRQTEEQIRDAAIASIAAIRKREKQMNADLYNTYGEDTFEFMKEKVALQECLDNLVSTCNLTDIVVKDNSIELLLLKKEIQDKLNMQLKQRLREPPLNIKRLVKFVPGSMVFGALDVDGNNSFLTDSQECIPTKIRKGCDVILQTDDPLLEERFTTMGKEIFDNDTHYTQTEFEFMDWDEIKPSLETRGTTMNKSIVISSQSTMTHPPDLTNTETMTENIEVMKRKVQTDSIPTLEQETETDILMELEGDQMNNIVNNINGCNGWIYKRDQFTNTRLYDTCDRQTLTIMKNFKEQVTQTTTTRICDDNFVTDSDSAVASYFYPKMNCRDSEMLTESIKKANKSTFTNLAQTADKITSTTRIKQINQMTSTPHIIMLDMATTVCIPGQDKAIGTKTIVTMDSSCGNAVAGTSDVGVSTEKEEKPDFCDSSTSTGLIQYSERASSPHRVYTDEKCIETNQVKFWTSSTNTRTYSVEEQGIGTEPVVPTIAVCRDTQTDLSFAFGMLKKNVIPCHKSTYTEKECLAPAIETQEKAVGTLEYSLSDMAVGTKHIDFEDNSTSTFGLINLVDSGFSADHISLRHIDVETDRVTLKDTGSETCAPKTCETGVFTTDNVETSDTGCCTEISFTPTTIDEDVFISRRKSMEDQVVNVTTLVSLDAEKSKCTMETGGILDSSPVHGDPSLAPALPAVESRVANVSPTLVHIGTLTDEVVIVEKKPVLVDSGTLAYGPDLEEISLDEVFFTTTSKNLVNAATGDRDIRWSIMTDSACGDSLAFEVDTQTTSKELVSTGTMTTVKSIMDSHTTMDFPFTTTQGTCTPSILTTDQATDGHINVSSCATMTIVIPTIDSGTDMPHPFTKTVETSTVAVPTADKDTLVEKTLMSDRSTMTFIPRRHVGILKRPHAVSRGFMANPIETKEKQTLTRPTPTVEQGCGTEHFSMEDKEIEAKVYNNVTKETCSNDLISMVDGFTDMPLILQASRETSPLSAAMSDRGCSPVRTIMKDQHVSAIAEMCDNNTLTMPKDVKDSETSMKPCETVEASTGTLCVSHASRGVTPVHWPVQDQEVLATVDMSSKEIGTPVIKSVETGHDPIVVLNNSRGTSMEPVDTKETASSTMAYLTAEAGTTMPQVCQVSREVTPVKWEVQDQAVLASVSTSTKECGTPNVHMTDSGENPIHFPGNDIGISTILTVTKDTACSTENKTTVETGTGMLQVSLTERETTPVSWPVNNQEVLATVCTSNKETCTASVETNDAATGTQQVLMQNTSTEMPQVFTDEKETFTPQVVLVNKNIATDAVLTSTKQTATPIDIMAPYIDHLSSKEEEVVKVSRGTSTTNPAIVDRETSPVHQLTKERATSPLHTYTKDKCVYVTRALLMEPRETFQTTGGVKKVLRNDERKDGSPFSRSLAPIVEDTKESTAEERLGSVHGRTRQRRSMSTSTSSPVRTHVEKFWSSTANTTLKKESTFSSHGSLPSSSIRCRVEMGTNTDDFEMANKETYTHTISTMDKAISTESVSVDTKMAECINKLKTVRQRLEQQTNAGQTQPYFDTTPIYSRANMDGTQSMALTSVTPTLCGLTISSTQQLPPSRPIAIGRSKSLGEKLNEKEGSMVPFLTPEPHRKKPVSEKITKDNVLQEDNKKKTSLARKQRLDMTQLLRSSSAPEGGLPGLPQLKVKPVKSQVIPKLDTTSLSMASSTGVQMSSIGVGTPSKTKSKEHRHRQRRSTSRELKSPTPPSVETYPKRKLLADGPDLAKARLAKQKSRLEKQKPLESTSSFDPLPLMEEDEDEEEEARDAAPAPLTPVRRNISKHPSRMLPINRSPTRRPTMPRLSGMDK